ncbi:ankyrin repeat domain-containing protein [Intestinicryptomonas porci]|uniref:Ankyrin repeat domain-containing protein n=1 Tax=Intestinicryptomonas porci TaxID=2926320 RepID=A0ABU4WJM4_9BACT|nr:ankyrin repeat domain-containing protein [Opitutales bacterium CLA-KB-P66]
MQIKDEEYYTKKLFEYAQSANFEGVKHVIALGADFNAFYGDYLNDRNVLMDASKAGSLMIVKFLIEDCGVEPSLYPEWHFFIEACKSGNLELVKYIHKLGPHLMLTIGIVRIILRWQQFILDIRIF